MLDRKLANQLVELKVLNAQTSWFFPQTTASVETNSTNTEKEMTDTNTATNHLKNRAREVLCAHAQALDNDFLINEPAVPSSFEEALARLNAGEFTRRTKDARRSRYDSWLDEIVSWRKPNEQADYEGRAKAGENLSKAYKHLTDAIMVESGDKALKALHALEAKASTTFH